MAEILQKSANFESNSRHQQLIRSGILTPAGFDNHFSVQGYVTSEDLKPFVSHYWIMRWDVPDGEVHRPVEILSQPVTHVFFTVDEAFIYGVINGMFDYEARGKGVIAGITFRPGGFHPFLGGSMDMLTGKQTSLADVFSENAILQSTVLLSRDDRQIVAAIERLLHTKTLDADPNIVLIGAIIDAIMTDDTMTTVEAVAERFHKKERTLQHLFKTYVGVGVKWIIMRTRLLEAVKQAYIAEHPNWAQIAADLGYSSQAHFINDFRRVVGKSPAQFIKTVLY